LIVDQSIYVVGAGYVGFSTGVALANKYNVVLIDPDQDKIEKINNGVSPLAELDLAKNLIKNKSKINTSSELSVVEDNSIVFVAVPTDYDESKGKFNTTVLDNVLNDLVKDKPNCKIVIKSTIPIGYTSNARIRLSNNNIYFAPEFLREGKAYDDVVNPDRIIVSPKSSDANKILNLLRSITFGKGVNCFCTDSSTAEAIKLFANTYLAMRVAYFNELDTFSILNKLNSEDLIKGICMDQRIGMFYNNPSFGYGGYCLPKDTKQTQNETIDLPMILPDAVVRSNSSRINFLAEDIKNKFSGKIIGIYRLSMKSGSDNVRSSSSTALLMQLIQKGFVVYLYEPLAGAVNFSTNKQINVVKDFVAFTKKVDVIIANRLDEEIINSGIEIYTRDVFNEN
jgi:UDPglucose 6-dehydrogenase